METQLAQASRDGRHIRTYIVQYKHAIEVGDIIEYNFEHYGLNSKGKYYEWCDQLPDGSFPEVPNWATANAGFAMARGTAKPEEYPTTPIEGEGVDGRACVKLETSSTGSFGAMFKMPIAAGNLYLGTFDSSKALTMTLKATRFGDGSTLERQLDRFTGHYKFYPGSQMTDKDGKPTDGEDRPAIYCIIYKNHDEQGNPVVIFGDDVQTSPQIIARAEVTDWQVNTDEWVEFDLPFVWKEDIDPDILANKGYNVAIVCSSSKNGDAFVGAVGSRLYLSSLRHRRHIEQSCLSEKQRFNLERVVAVVCRGVEGQRVCPCLEGVAVDSKAEVACQRGEERALPRPLRCLDALLYGLGLLLQTLGLQGAHPRVNGQTRQRTYHTVARWVAVGAE